MSSRNRRLIHRVLAPRRLAHAHSGTHSYVILTIDQRRVSGSVQFPVHDLGHVLGVDFEGGDEGLLATVADRLRDIRDYADKHLAIRSESAAWRVDVTGIRVLERTAGSYAILEFQVLGAPRDASVTIDYDGLLHERDHHEALVIVRTFSGVGRMRSQREQQFAFSPSRTSAEFELSRTGASAAAKGTATFLVAELKEVGRRVGKRLLRR